MIPWLRCLAIAWMALGLLGQAAQARLIETNEVAIPDAPKWLTLRMVERTVARIQNFLEWDIRKIQVIWYFDAGSFRKAHGFDESVLAFAKRGENAVHVGPKVTQENFEAVFGHELVHVILFQKYKDAIPKWLDEGLANFASKHGRVDYKWLASQPFQEITSLAHPFREASGGSSTLNSRYHYQVSTAAMEMLASKCGIHDLLQLSTAAGLEKYLSTLCGIHDLNTELRKWLKRKASR